MTRYDVMAFARWSWLLAVAALVLASCGEPPMTDLGAVVPPRVVVRTEPASVSQCPYGGSVVSSGKDTDHSGTLDDTEIAMRSVVCNPAPMELPPVIAVRLVAEPPGTNCAAGGTAVQSGPDQNRNGALDDAEVVHVDYVCGQVLLTRLVAEPEGAHCTAGGVAFLAGRDRDDDQVLDDGEVEVTEYECGDVLSRDVELRSAADVAALANIRVISGNLTTRLVALEEIALPRLEHVGGGLEVSVVARTRLSLPQLRDVGGTFRVAGDISAIECPQVHRVGALEIQFIGTQVQDLSGLSALTEVDRDVEIRDNSGLISIELSNLSIGGDLEIEGNRQLTRVAATLWDQVGWVSISHNALLVTADVSVVPLHGASSLIDAVDLFSDPVLSHFSISADRVDSLFIGDDPVITDIGLDVAKFEFDVLLFNITTPFRLALSSPRGAGRIEFGGDLAISGPLSSFTSSAPVIVDDLLVFDDTRLQALDASARIAEARGGVRFSDNARLTEITPFTLGDGLQLINNAVLVRTPVLPLLDPGALRGVVITDNPVLTSVPSLAAVARVGLIVELQRNARLGQDFGPALTRIDGALLIGDNGSLTQLRLPNLTHVRQLTVGTSPVLQSIELPALIDVPEELFVTRNPRLHHIVFDSLSQVGGFFVTANPVLPSCEVRAVFAHVTGFTVQSGNDDQATCGQ